MRKMGVIGLVVKDKFVIRFFYVFRLIILEFLCERILIF